MAHVTVVARRYVVLRRLGLVAAATAVILTMAVPGITGAAETATPAPSANPSITLVAEAMLGGSVRQGTWAAIHVTVENSGPAVEGELRLSNPGGQASTVAVAVHLATGARQEHFLYGKAEAFRGRFELALASGALVHATTLVPVEINRSGAPAIAIVAERPQAIVGPLNTAAAAGAEQPSIVTLAPSDLPPRVEPWSSIDTIVWQDAESRQLDASRVEALRTWVATGGQLVILAGSTGATTLAGFPDDLLPYRPVGIVEAPIADVEAFIGDLPDDTAALTSLSGPLERGIALARTGDAVIAARAPHGRGSVSLIGIDPTIPPLLGTSAVDALWARAVPASVGIQDGPVATDDSFVARALGNLPAVQLRGMGVVFLLMVAYIVVIGPLNYVLLRRRDRREWAWLTVPAAIVGFAAAAYVFGMSVRGPNVVINELAIVHGAAGTDRGLAEVHVGVFSPGRTALDVRVGHAPLVSALNAREFNEFGAAEDQPVNVLLGDPTTLRDYGVGFGALRSFRAETAVTAPRVDAELELVEGVLRGSIVNSSEVMLSDVAVVYGGAFHRVGDLAPAQSQTISVDSSRAGGFDEQLSWRLFPGADEDDVNSLRTVAARRAIVQHLAGGWDESFGGPATGVLARGPVILAWQSGPTLEIDIASTADHVGERLYLLPVTARLSGPVVFSRGAITPSTVSLDALDGSQDLGAYTVNQGTVTVDYRPTAFDGSFVVADLSFRLGRESATPPPRAGDERLVPLPPAEQPDPDAPLAVDPRPDGPDDLPRIQLWDRIAATWVEFEPVLTSTTYAVPDPGRHVDASGTFRVRFVVRTSDYVTFSFAPRLAGTVE